MHIGEMQHSQLQQADLPTWQIIKPPSDPLVNPAFYVDTTSVFFSNPHDPLAWDFYALDEMIDPFYHNSARRQIGLSKTVHVFVVLPCLSLQGMSGWSYFAMLTRLVDKYKIEVETNHWVREMVPLHGTPQLIAKTEPITTTIKGRGDRRFKVIFHLVTQEYAVSGNRVNPFWDSVYFEVLQMINPQHCYTPVLRESIMAGMGHNESVMDYNTLCHVFRSPVDGSLHATPYWIHNVRPLG